MARGDEILIADSIERDRAGLRKMFEEEGYVCTAVSSAAEARDLIERKFFPAAVVDLDLDAPNHGLELLRYMGEHSRPTAVILLTGRRSFESAVEALRLGVVDVVSKRPDQVTQLSAAVRLAVDRHRATNKDGTLLREVRTVLDDAFKIMLSMGRRLYGDGSHASNASVAVALPQPSILIVDDDAQFLQEVSQHIDQPGWKVAVEMSGGAALDKASSFAFQIVAAREQLMDLPGPMVIKSIQAQQPRTLGLVYTAPGPQGHIHRFEGGRTTKVDRPFQGAKELVDNLPKPVLEGADKEAADKAKEALEGAGATVELK
jgi:DNA-binding NtrC family response regulator